MQSYRRPEMDIYPSSSFYPNYQASIRLRKIIPVVEFLSQLPGVDPAAQYNWAIIWAAHNGHLPVVEFLSQLPGIDPDAGDNEAIRLAAANGHLSVVEFLVSLPSVDPAAKDNEAIESAALNGHLPVVEFLSRLPSVLIHALNRTSPPTGVNHDLFSELHRPPDQWSRRMLLLWLNVPGFYTCLKHHHHQDSAGQRHVELYAIMQRCIWTEVVSAFPPSPKIIPDLHPWIIRYLF